MYSNILSHLTALLPLLVPSLSILIISISLAILLKRKLVETVFLSNSVIILTLFLTGILNFKGSLLLGYAAIIVLSFLSLGFFISSYIRERGIIKEISLLPGLILFSVFLLIAVYLNYGRMFIIWDEFSHWGSVLNHMYNLDALASLKNAVGQFARTYPPASSLFQYFWMRPFPEFTEYPAYIASNMFFFSLVMMFLRKFNLKAIIFLLSSLLIPVTIPFMQEYNFFSSLYVDPILGILLGFMLIVHYDDYFEGIYKTLAISCISVLLTLTKDTGFIFALIGNSIVLLDYLLFQKKLVKKFFNKDLNFLKKLHVLIPAILPTLTTLLSKTIWSLHLKIVGAASVLDQRPINLKNLIRQDFLPYQNEVLQNFKTALIEKPINPLGIPALRLALVVCILFFLFSLAFNTKLQKTKRLAFGLSALMLGWIGYASALLVAYLFVFGQNEATILASYSRYMLSYIIAFFYFSLVFVFIKSSIFLKRLKDRENLSTNLRIILSVLLIFSVYYTIIDKAKKELKEITSQARVTVHNTITTRQEYDKARLWADTFHNNGENIYIITQGSNGFDTLVLMHTLYPSDIGWRSDYSVALTPYYEHFELGDPWTMIISPEDWSKYVLDNYDLVYIFKYDEKFKQTYGDYFDTLENNALYEVTTNTNGILELVSIPKP